ncbi:hypothetical protein D3C84_911320 [compost metagenome]
MLGTGTLAGVGVVALVLSSVEFMVFSSSMMVDILPAIASLSTRTFLTIVSSIRQLSEASAIVLSLSSISLVNDVIVVLATSRSPYSVYEVYPANAAIRINASIRAFRKLLSIISPPI